MASGQAYDAAESQSLLGATITSDMDLTDMSFNDFFSFTDDVSTADRMDGTYMEEDDVCCLAFLFSPCFVYCETYKCSVALCFSYRYLFFVLSGLYSTSPDTLVTPGLWTSYTESFTMDFKPPRE